MLSGGVALSRVQSGVLGPFGGWLIDRFGPRRLMIGGAALLAVGYLLLPHVDSIVAFYLVFVLCLSIGADFGFGSPPGAAVANWFRRKRGLAIGIYISGTGFGALLVPAIAWLVHYFGWRGAASLLAFVALGLGLPLASLMRHRPEPYGLRPDGDPEEKQTAAAIQDSRRRPEANFSVREALKTRAFWLMSASFGLRGFVAASIGVHLIPAFDEKGYNATQAGAFLAIIGLLSVLGRLTVGWLGDRFDHRYLGALTSATLAAAALLFPFAHAFWALATFAVLYGASDGGLVSNMLVMRADYYGSRNYATIGGIMSPVVVLGSIVGPLLTGYIFDVTESYVLAFYVFSAMTAAAAVCILLAKRPEQKQMSTG